GGDAVGVDGADAADGIEVEDGAALVERLGEIAGGEAEAGADVVIHVAGDGEEPAEVAEVAADDLVQLGQAELTVAIGVVQADGQAGVQAAVGVGVEDGVAGEGV